jgi:HlyD family secretion protein
VRGDVVAVGAPLCAQDDADDRSVWDQAAQMLAQAARQLVNLESGGKPTEIAQNYVTGRFG